MRRSFSKHRPARHPVMFYDPTRVNMAEVAMHIFEEKKQGAGA